MPKTRSRRRAMRRGAVLGMALCALFFMAGCRTAGPIAQSSTDFRLQNIEAALVKMQGEVKALESKQAEGDKTWGEVRSKLDELTQLLRSRTAAAGVAPAAETPPPWAGQIGAASPPAGTPSASPQAPPAAQTAAPAATGKQPTPFGATSRWAANGKGQPAPQSDVGRPFPAVAPGQTAQAVQAASTAAPSPPPAATTASTSAAAPGPSPTPEPAAQSPAAELAAAPPAAPAPVSAATPGGNPAKAWELPGPDAATRPATPPPAASAPPPSSPSPLSPYPAVLPPAAEASSSAAPAPTATAVQGPAPVPGRVPTPLAPAAAPTQTAGPVSGKPSSGEEADYNKALKLALNGKPREARAAFSEFLTRHPQSALEPNVRYWIGESDYIQGDMTQAAKSFGEVSTRYAGHHKAADSLYKFGMVQEKLGDTAAARAAYESLIKDYPSSELTGNAKRKLEQLPR